MYASKKIGGGRTIWRYFLFTKLMDDISVIE